MVRTTAMLYTAWYIAVASHVRQAAQSAKRASLPLAARGTLFQVVLYLRRQTTAVQAVYTRTWYMRYITGTTAARKAAALQQKGRWGSTGATTTAAVACRTRQLLSGEPCSFYGLSMQCDNTKGSTPT